MSEAEILFVTRKWAPAMGGMETYSLRLTEAIARQRGIEIVALEGRANGMPPSPPALFGFPFTILRRWLARKQAARVLHIGDMALWPVGLLAGAGTKVVLSAHGTDVSYHRRGGLKGRLYGTYLKLGAKLLKRATVIANSQATRAVAAETGWKDARVVPLATDIAGAEVDGTHNGRLLFAGRLVERKGCGWFIREVLPLLPAAIELDVAGTVWTDAERALLADPRVRYLGPLAGAELAEAYRRALCVVVPNIPVASGEYEGFGLVAPEAAAAGGIVLAARCDGLVDAVIDGETGILVEPGDPAAWRDAIVEIAQWDGSTRLDFAKTAMAVASRRYSWDRVASEVLAIYDEAASSPRQA
ncbi:MAG TPA: glycosyltransferase family 4 protein [Sphingomonadaceae bacterium]|nr:glycosyltransferase family 4 protein [Sphingomonadaceae bacterium]